MRSTWIGIMAGFIFAIGLGLAGMTKPSKVIGFLDIFGAWDPSLMFVMVGAIAVYSTSYHLIIRRKAPLFAAKFDLPVKKHVDKPLLIGSAMFGIGWGLGGMCPAPALTALMSGHSSVVLFVLAMLTGMYAFQSMGPKV